MSVVICDDFESNKENTVVLEQVTIERTVVSVVEAIKKELPEEAHTVEVMELVLEETRAFLKTRKVSL